MFYKLSDGTVVEQSTRKSNRSGYTYATFSVAWTLDSSKPFIACCGNPTDPAIMKLMRHQHRQTWHGGHYSDAREAAYVSEIFKKDPVMVDGVIADQGAWTDFPADLYNLPVIMTAEEAQDIIRKERANTVVRVKKIRKEISTDNRAAHESFLPKYGKDVAAQLIAKFGKDLIWQEIKLLTLNEFELRYGLMQAA